MAEAINQDGSTFSGRNEVQNGIIIQVGNISAGGNVNIGTRIYSET
jgi:hypothetical protein